jgi:hypothetical protein
MEKGDHIFSRRRKRGVYKRYKGASVGGKAPRIGPSKSKDLSLLLVTFNLIRMIDYKAFFAWCEDQKGKNNNLSWNDYCKFDQEKKEKEKEKEKGEKGENGENRENGEDQEGRELGEGRECE